MKILYTGCCGLAARLSCVVLVCVLWSSSAHAAPPKHYSGEVYGLAAEMQRLGYRVSAADLDRYQEMVGQQQARVASKSIAYRGAGRTTPPSLDEQYRMGAQRISDTYGSGHTTTINGVPAYVTSSGVGVHRIARPVRNPRINNGRPSI